MTMWLGFVACAAAGALVGLIAGLWISGMAHREDLRAADERRPLLADGAMAALRPGDTGILLCQLDGMTPEQQARMIESLKKTAVRARERGIELIVIPEFGGQKVIVVPRAGLAEHADDGAL